MVASTYVGVGEVGLLSQVEDADVVLHGPGAVLGVEVDGRDRNVPLAWIILIPVVFTNCDGKTAGAVSVTIGRLEYEGPFFFF